MTIRVGIVDPYEIVRDGLKLFLETTEDLVFVGEASSADEAVQLCEQQQPHVILYDFLPDDGSTLSVMGSLCRHFPQLSIVVLTAIIEPERVKQLLTLDVVGCLTKHHSIEVLEEVIRAASMRVRVMDAEVSAVLARQGYPLDGTWKVIASDDD